MSIKNRLKKLEVKLGQGMNPVLIVETDKDGNIYHENKRISNYEYSRLTNSCDVILIDDITRS